MAGEGFALRAFTERHDPQRMRAGIRRAGSALAPLVLDEIRCDDPFSHACMGGLARRAPPFCKDGARCWPR